MSISKNVRRRRQLFLASAGLAFFVLSAVEGTVAEEASLQTMEETEASSNEDQAVTASDRSAPPPEESQDFVMQGDNRTTKQGPEKKGQIAEDASKPDSR